MVPISLLMPFFFFFVLCRFQDDLERYFHSTVVPVYTTYFGINSQFSDSSAYATGSESGSGASSASTSTSTNQEANSSSPQAAFPSGTPVPYPTMESYFQAYALVSSRAFLVDAYHGLAMVPVADA
jgi:hypothetical protein